MWKIARTGGTISIAGLFSGMLEADYDKVDLRKTSQEFYRKRLLETESGSDRLYLMFSVDELGNLSPEIASTLQGGMFAGFVGMVFGGYARGKEAYFHFMERNTATQFLTPFEAKKKLQDTVTINFVRGAASWGWRLWLFSSTYMLCSNAIAAYRGKSGILEHTVGAALAGSMYKFNLGPRAMFAGCLAGAALGTIGGTITFVMLKATGYSAEDIRYWQYYWQTNRDQKIQEVFKHHGQSDVMSELDLNHERINVDVKPEIALEKIPENSSKTNNVSGKT